MVPPSPEYVALRTPRGSHASSGKGGQPCKEVAVEVSRTAEPSVDDSRVSLCWSSAAKSEKTKKVALWELYRFATRTDLVLLALAGVFACVNGVLYPCLALVFGHAIAGFDPYDSAAVGRAAFEFLAIAVALLVTDFLMYALFGSTSERLAKRMREAALRHLLSMDVSWYDTHSNETLQLSSRITGDTIVIKNGLGQKLGDVVKFTAQFAGGYAIGFAMSWDMALVMSCIAPLTVCSMSYLIGMLQNFSKASQKVYAGAGAIADETLSSMRTVASLNGEKRAIERYDAKSKIVEDSYIQVFRRAGIVQGIYTGSQYLMYGAGLWYGGWKVYNSELAPSVVFQAFFGIVLGTRSMGQISPSITAVATAQGAAVKLYEILDTQPSIDASASDGLRPESCHGELVLRDVHFTYPSRPQEPVLRGLDLTIRAGQTVAFVGPSGGGKSTIWLRAQIGLVSQEPVLFATSVFENIAAGCASLDVTEDDVVAAAKLANAHDFIMELTEGYDTQVGEKGTALSGGQKQRIAIARAMVRRPTILVLDEATSALDNESERVVQAALTSVMQQQSQMTTIVIAHRLSTIRAVDKIVVMAHGRVAEQGTHEELVMREDGIYKAMLKSQETETETEPETETETETEAESESEKELDGGAAATVVADSSAAGEPHQAETGLPPASGDTNTPVVTTSKKKKSTFFDKLTFFEMMKYSGPERTYYSVGMVASVVQGLALPCSALLISEILALMTDKYARFEVTDDRTVLKQLSDDVRGYGQWYFLGACIAGCAHWVQVYCFRFMAAKLTTRLRHEHFKSMCRQDIAFFDEANHSTGALKASLESQSAQVSLLTGDAQGKLLQAATTLVGAVLVAFLTGSWVLTLIMLLILPFILAGEVIRNKQMKGSLHKADDLADASSQASQALCGVRTVMAFGLEKSMCEAFSAALDKPQHEGTKAAKISGLAVGYSSFVVFATYSLIFWYGGVLVDRDSITFKELMRTLMAILMASEGVGFAASWVAESDTALKAGKTILDVRDRPHAIDALRDDDGKELDPMAGRLEFRSVVFRYPTRPEVTVLNEFNLTIEANQTVGFCGTSGGGKSTIVALVERFYDPVQGQVLLDSNDLTDLSVAWLRRQIGYVGQEPTLFIGSIAENIAYGLDVPPSQSDIERAARLANAHGFIMNLGDKYATQVGASGVLMSGGQKQRIAIARAILRDPRILILDEATSALDSASEREVQAALDTVVATERCTTLVIAHRLSTLRSCDKICVVDQGRVAEEGPHDQLLRLDGLYAKLLASSSSSSSTSTVTEIEMEVEQTQL